MSEDYLRTRVQFACPEVAVCVSFDCVATVVVCTVEVEDVEGIEGCTVHWGWKPKLGVIERDGLGDWISCANSRRKEDGGS